MRTRQERVATDTWRSLGYRTTPLEHGAKENQQLNPGGPNNQTKKLRPQLTKINSFMSGPSSSHQPTGVQLKREAKLFTVIGLQNKHADCRIIVMLYPIRL